MPHCSHTFRTGNIVLLTLLWACDTIAPAYYGTFDIKVNAVLFVCHTMLMPFLDESRHLRWEIPSDFHLNVVTCT